MALTKQYGWYVENGQIAIVEGSTSENKTWDAVSTTGKTVKLIVRCLPTNFDKNLTDADKTINLPSIFRRTIADLAISRFYEIPPYNENSIALTRHFFSKYTAGLKEIKKYSNNNLTGAEQIVPHYF